MNLYEYDFSNLRLATVLATDRITPPNDPVEVRHLVLEVPEDRLDYLEGQSIAILVPGPHEFGGAFHFRLYSIASPRHGEDGKAEGSLIASATDLTSPNLYKSGTSAGEIFRSIRDGAGDQMPAFKSQLGSEADVWNLVNFIRSLWPESVRPPLQEDSK